MKYLVSLSALAAGTLLGSAAFAAGFSGAAAPGNFTIANTGTLSGAAPAQGSAIFSATQLVLVGQNTGDANLGCTGGVYSVLSPCQLQVTIATPGTYSFDWSYITSDRDGPAGDMFGVIINGNRITLSDLGGAIAQTGNASFVATSSFGWFMNCTDCTGGFANATISNFNLGPVPEPGTWAMWLAGGAGVIAMRRRLTRRA